MEQKLISMTEKELIRYDVIKNLIEGQINGSEASKQVGLSVRQVRRIKTKVKRKGAEAIIHGNRGKSSNRKLSFTVKENIKKHLKEKYHYFKPTFASEKLDENHGIKVSKETIRNIMIDMGLWKPKPRKQSKNGIYGDQERIITEKWNNLMVHIIIGLEMKKHVYYYQLMMLLERLHTVNLITMKAQWQYLISGGAIWKRTAYLYQYI